MQEVYDVLDKNGHKIGATKTRGDIFKKDEYMGVVNVLVYAEGDFLVTKRHPNKPYGNYYEITGGGILAGEDALKAAKRELKEEVGIETDNLILLGEATDYHFYVYTYLVILAKKPAITLQEKETVAYKWLNKTAFVKKIHQDNFLYFVQERLDAYQDEIEYLIKETK